ncbi:MAG: hypothetical protein Q4F57_07675 [Weeksellaceae bacterium]|nr:hypothetical protein [Weeksellaceae bacterium]
MKIFIKMRNMASLQPKKRVGVRLLLRGLLAAKLWQKGFSVSTTTPFCSHFAKAKIPCGVAAFHLPRSEPANHEKSAQLILNNKQVFVVSFWL